MKSYPSYEGIIINHYKDPYQTTRFPSGASSFPSGGHWWDPGSDWSPYHKSSNLWGSWRNWGVWVGRMGWGETEPLIFFWGGGVWNDMKMGGNWINFEIQRISVMGNLMALGCEEKEDLSPRNKNIGMLLSTHPEVCQEPPPFSRKICSKSLTRNIQHELCWVGCGVIGWRNSWAVYFFSGTSSV